jgi:hypothetical protein
MYRSHSKQRSHCNEVHGELFLTMIHFECPLKEKVVQRESITSHGVGFSVPPEGCRASPAGREVSLR